MLSTWFMSSDSFMSVTGLCSFFRSALYFTCGHRGQARQERILLVQPGLGELPTTQRRDLGGQVGISPPGKAKANVPRWPCCGRPSGSCRFWPPSNHTLAFYPSLWQSSPCISPEQRTPRCHSCSAGLTSLAAAPRFPWGWLGEEQKCRNSKVSTGIKSILKMT